MKVKFKNIIIELEVFLILIFITCALFETVFEFYYYFFACYLFISFHEITHILMATLFGKKLLKVKLTLCGTCAIFDEKSFCGNKYIELKELIVYFAGPLSNILLAIIFKNNIMIRNINIALAAINIIPIYPLDGYNILDRIFKIILSEKYNHKLIKKVSMLTTIIILLLNIYILVVYKNSSCIIFIVYLIFIKISCNNKNV